MILTARKQNPLTPFVQRPAHPLLRAAEDDACLQNKFSICCNPAKSAAGLHRLYLWARELCVLHKLQSMPGDRSRQLSIGAWSLASTLLPLIVTSSFLLLAGPQQPGTDQVQMRSLLNGKQCGCCVASPVPICAGLVPQRGWQLSWESGGQWQLHLPGCGRRPSSVSSGYC